MRSPDPSGSGAADASGDEPEPEPGRWRTSLLVPVAIIAVAALAIAGIVIVAIGEQDRGMATLAGSSVDQTTLPQTMPLELVDGHLVVRARLGDAPEPVGLILDTGSPTILTTALIDRHGGDPTGRITSASIDGVVSSSDVVRIAELRLGDASFADAGAVDGFIAADDPLACISDAGLLGASLMHDAVWRIDPDAGELTIAAGLEDLPDRPGSEGTIEMPFERASTAAPSPVVELRAGEGILRLLVDTGSDGWLMVNPADLDGTGSDLPPDAPAVRTLGSGASGTFETRVAWTTLDLGLGELSLADVPIATSEVLAPGQGNIGTAFLSNYVLTIDWTADRLYLEPLTDDPRPADPLSVVPTWGAGGYVVGAVVEGVPEVAGVPLGASVRAIDGSDVASASFDAFCQADAAPDGEAHELTITQPPMTVPVFRVDDFFATLPG